MPWDGIFCSGDPPFSKECTTIRCSTTMDGDDSEPVGAVTCCWRESGFLFDHFFLDVQEVYHNLRHKRSLKIFFCHFAACNSQKNDSARYLHLLNALKYSTSLFPLCISAYQKTMTSSEDDQFKVERILVIFLAINAGYSFAWDVVMDWGMAQNPISCTTTGGEGASFLERSCMRPRLRFGAVASLAILVADAFLRGSWMLRFYDKYMFSNVDTYVLTTQFLEIFRWVVCLSFCSPIGIRPKINLKLKPVSPIRLPLDHPSPKTSDMEPAPRGLGDGETD